MNLHKYSVIYVLHPSVNKCTCTINLDQKPQMSVPALLVITITVSVIYSYMVHHHITENVVRRFMCSESETRLRFVSLFLAPSRHHRDCYRRRRPRTLEIPPEARVPTPAHHLHITNRLSLFIGQKTQYTVFRETPIFSSISSRILHVYTKSAANMDEEQ